jgi:hypothetical protein
MAKDEITRTRILRPKMTPELREQERIEDQRWQEWIAEMGDLDSPPEPSSTTSSTGRETTSRAKQPPKTA